MAAPRLAVGVSPVLGPILRAYKQFNATNPQRREAILYRVVKSAVEAVISDPAHAMDSAHRLTGNLAGVRRLKFGPESRYRLFYLCAPEKGRSILLWLGYRKAGDKNDAYAEMARRVGRGDFDEQFKDLGIPRPDP